MNATEDLYVVTSLVSDCGVTYQLELRAQLPDATARQLEAMLPAAWARPIIVSCRDFWSARPRTDCPPE